MKRPRISTAFFSDGVDHVADFLVAEEQTDEPRDVGVVDGDLGFAFMGDNQVLLLVVLSSSRFHAETP